VSIPRWCKDNRGKQYVMERGKAWSKYLAHTNYVFNLSRPYASTIHKAQGSEFDNIFISVEDIKKARYNQEMYKRLMYVALSRARHTINYI
jgi:ATP-dependent exoDNAse (exonuclease V) alpha subunit